MKAAILHGPGETPVYGDFAEPVAGDGRELVELVAAGIHPLTRSLAEGRHYGSSGAWPLIPGVDAVARDADGTLVYTGFTQPPYGTLAERMAVPSGSLPVPDAADPATIAAGVNPGMASWLPLQARLAETGALGTVAIVGVTGMSGLLAVQNARLLGATNVVGAGRSAERLAQAATYGATTVQLTGDWAADAASFADALGSTTPGNTKCGLVLDFVWGPPAEAMFAALGGRGLGEDDADISYTQIGSLAGSEAALPASLLRSRHIRISGSGAGSVTVATIVAQLPGYMRLIADGDVRVPVRPFPLSRIADAWAASRDNGPRVVVTSA
jgi:NADPH:quinone reductase-like Zn-dependent oxidoreductase